MWLFQELNAAVPTIRDRSASGDDLLNAVERCATIIDGLAHPIRLALFAHLRSNGPASLSQLQDQFPMKRAVLNHHLGMMCDRYLLSKKRKGRSVLYRINDEVFEFIRQYLGTAFGPRN